VRNSWAAILRGVTLESTGVPAIFDDTTARIDGAARGASVITAGMTGNVTVMVYARMVTGRRTNTSD